MAKVYEDSDGGGNWSFREAAAKGIAGTIGILAALIIDYVQKGNDSALLFATRLVNEAALSRFQIEAVPPSIYLAVLVIAGFALVYIFEPTNKRNAFYAGAGVLGFLATFAPITHQTFQAPSSGELPSLESLLPSGEAVTPETPADPGDNAFNDNGASLVIRAAYRPFPKMTSAVRAQASGLPVNIVIQFPSDQNGNEMPQVSAWLHDNLSNRTMTLGAGAKIAKTSAGPVVLYQTVITPMQSGGTIADLAVRVEAAGYKITTEEMKVTAQTAQPVRLDVVLERSNTPLAFQRLQYPYRW